MSQNKSECQHGIDLVPASNQYPVWVALMPRPSRGADMVGSERETLLGVALSGLITEPLRRPWVKWRKNFGDM